MELMKLQGQCDALMQVILAMLATHPKQEEIFKLVTGVVSKNRALAAGSPHAENYLAGMDVVLGQLAAVSKLAAQAATIRDTPADPAKGH